MMPRGLDSGLTDPPVLDVRHLRTWLDTDQGLVKAVEDVSFSVGRGRTLAIVGESGSGKSMASLSVLRLHPVPPARIVEGEVWLDGRQGRRNLLDLSADEIRRVRGREVSMIFQEPMTSLNPVLRVGEQIAESIRLHEGVGRKAALAGARRLLELVEIPEPGRRLDEYPHQLSGGMRQRVMIAVALAGNPALLIADEPTTALDVTIQLQILRLVRRLQDELGMAVVFITHNLGVVAQVADEVVVMYCGRVVEQASATELFARPRHPYTRGLLACLPQRERGSKRRRLEAIPGTVASPADPPPGCPFEPRCFMAEPVCRAELPALQEVTSTHRSRCHFWERL